MSSRSSAILITNLILLITSRTSGRSRARILANIATSIVEASTEKALIRTYLIEAARVSCGINIEVKEGAVERIIIDTIDPKPI